MLALALAADMGSPTAARAAIAVSVMSFMQIRPLRLSTVDIATITDPS
jgi:hypothetical protein